MKKKVFGKQLSRDTNERKALFKGLINSLVMLESIQTTEAKAKSIKGQVEKLITKAKKLNETKSASGGKNTLSLLQPWLQTNALKKMVDDLGPRFANRPGGYTRIVKLGERFGDNAKMVIIEFVEKKTEEPKGTKETKEPKGKMESTIANPSLKEKQSPKKTKSVKSPNRPPSKAEMEKRKAGKGSPAKESKKEAK